MCVAGARGRSGGAAEGGEATLLAALLRSPLLCYLYFSGYDACARARSGGAAEGGEAHEKSQKCWEIKEIIIN